MVTPPAVKRNHATLPSNLPSAYDKIEARQPGDRIMKLTDYFGASVDTHGR